MRLIAAVPLVTSPLRLGISFGASLAGHPSTRLAGFAIDACSLGTPTWETAASVLAIAASQPEAILVVPNVELVERLGIKLPNQVIRAEDLCRLWGEPTWHGNAGDVIASAPTEPARRKALALCQDLNGKIAEIHDLVTPTEWAAYQCHQAINARGIHIDVDLVNWLREVISKREDVRRTKLGNAFHRDSMSVTEALAPGGFIDRLLAKHGLSLANRSEDALIDVIDSLSCESDLKAVLNGLIGHGRITKVKIEKIRSSVDADDQLRNQFVIWAARTWRFSSRGTQVQNLPRPKSGISYGDLARIIIDNQAAGTPSSVLDDLARIVPGGQVDDAFPSLLRMCFSAGHDHDQDASKELIVLDWNAIEPRIRAWLSDDHTHLDAWGAGRDLYSELISSIVGRNITKATDPDLRTIGKIADIGCGYHMGDESFDLLCSVHGVNLKELGLTARQVVRRYREKYKALSHPRSGLWARLHAGAIQAVQEGHAQVGKIAFSRTANGHLDMILPNGSRRRWWKAEVQLRSPPWVEPGDKSQDAPVVVVASTLGGTVDQVMYGGRILENACQAIGRELLVEFLIELHRRKIPVVSHCHDEVVAEGPLTKAPDIMAEIVVLAEKTPAWANGLPLRVEAFTSPVWSKDSPYKC